ncbi:MAG: hypothetical protein AABZ53_04995 [Planctomycetota bacterium]
MSQQNTNMNNPRSPRADDNRDPITGAPGSHPVGTGLGAVGAGAAVGIAAGALGGPVVASAGAVVGAVAGGLGGKAVAEAINPTIESKYWQDSHASRPYSHSEFGYDEYAPAYRYGWESFDRRTSDGKTFESVEGDLGRGWDQAKGKSRLVWDQAKAATRDAWDRVASAARGKN